MRNEYQENQQYRQLRQQIRDYIGSQISAEAALIEPAFENKGPRR